MNTNIKLRFRPNRRWSRLVHKLIVLPVFFVIGISSTPSIGAKSLITYQGRITDSGGLPVADGSHIVGFGLYTDSVGGSSLWFESLSIVTTNGFFSHLLGSKSALPVTIFTDGSALFLGIKVDGDNIAPRTRLTASAAAIVAGNLVVRDSNDSLAVKTFAEEHMLAVFDSTGSAIIQLRGVDGDSSLVLPEAAINSNETGNEPGIASDFTLDLITLSDGEMRDLALVGIKIPEDGYIVVYAKCYLLLSNTTGTNMAQVQIDETEGGEALFPYYTQAGLSGYVNTGVNYFPAFVTRIYYKGKGFYEFRLEGRATNALPALARSWDQIITAVYYPTSYESVGAAVLSPAMFPGALPIKLNSAADSLRPDAGYKIDLRDLE